MSALSAQLEQLFKAACIAELESLKPGNVHIFADGHGMVLQDFLRSAEASAIPMTQPTATVGQRILASVEATWSAVDCNTNLGIVLLCAPLVQAMLNRQESTLQESLRLVLRELTVADSTLAFQAILRASPAGLGQSGQHDVHSVPQVTLLEAMRAAEQRDLIAKQYATDYADVFEIGVPRYAEALQRWGRPAWAATAVYLGFLSEVADSHILRKLGEGAALAVQNEARAHARIFFALENPKTYQRELLQFDADLKARGINPGTCADMTVACLLVVAMEDLIRRPEVEVHNPEIRQQNDSAASNIRPSFLQRLSAFVSGLLRG